MRHRTAILFLSSLLVFLALSGARADSPYGSRGAGAAPQPVSPDTSAIPAGSVEATNEGFADITNLPGWVMQNNSNPLGVTNWFQGNDTVFTAYSGAPTAYIAANYNNTSGTGTISNWLLTPELSLANGDTISFYTRTATDSTWADRLQLRLSLNGSSTDVGVTAESVGVFSTLLLDINPMLAASGYPQTWTQYTVTLSGIPAGATGRVAFRYYVTNAGPSGANSNYIGIDEVYASSQVVYRQHIPLVMR